MVGMKISVWFVVGIFVWIRDRVDVGLELRLGIELILGLALVLE